MAIILSIPYLVWIILSALSFAAGEFFSKKFGLAPGWTYFFWIVASYMLGTVLWLPAIVEKNQLSIVGAIWSVLSLLATVLIGVLIFDERLSMVGIIGLILGFISVGLLSLA